MPKYVGYQTVREQFDVSAQTVKNWALRGAINYRAIQNSTRKTWLYDLESIGNYVDQQQVNNNEAKKQDEITVLYCRVSSQKQKSDLDRQCDLLSSSFPDCRVIKDIGSGLNFKRPGFSKMVEQICREEIHRVVVTYKDRLARFGFDFFKQICKEHSCKILVYSKEHELFDVEDEENRELQEDLLSIVNVFVARRNGKRSGLYRRERKKQEERNKLVTEDSIDT